MSSCESIHLLSLQGYNRHPLFPGLFRLHRSLRASPIVISTNDFHVCWYSLDTHASASRQDTRACLYTCMFLAFGQFENLNIRQDLPPWVFLRFAPPEKGSNLLWEESRGGQADEQLWKVFVQHCLIDDAFAPECA